MLERRVQFQPSEFPKGPCIGLSAESYLFSSNKLLPEALSSIGNPGSSDERSITWAATQKGATGHLPQPCSVGKVTVCIQKGNASCLDRQHGSVWLLDSSLLGIQLYITKISKFRDGDSKGLAVLNARASNTLTGFYLRVESITFLLSFTRFLIKADSQQWK